MSAQVQTVNLGTALPEDQTKNVPWGAAIQMLSTALQTVDGWITAAIAKLNAAATIAGLQANSYSYAADTGAANAYAVALTPAPTLAAGVGFYFKAVHANTGASTLALNGGTAKAVTKAGATALAGGEIAAGQICLVVYDGTEFQLISA